MTLQIHIERDTKIMALVVMWLWLTIITAGIQYYTNTDGLTLREKNMSALIYGFIFSSGITYALKEKINFEVDNDD